MNRLGDALSPDPIRLAQAHYHPRPVDRIPAPQHAGPPVKALIVYNCNPAAVCPDQAAVRQGLQREDLFTVVLEQFQTDTADYADYVLPATTQLEHWDILKPYGHTHLALNRPAIAPLGESLPNSEIFRRLAAAMGYREPCFCESDEQMLRDLVQRQKHPRFAGITWERLLAEGFARLALPQPYAAFAQGDFPTPSGKCEFYSERMALDGYDPLPEYTAPRWQQASAADEQIEAGSNAGEEWRMQTPAARQLVCISPPAHSYLNTTFGVVDRLRAREGEPLLQIHPRDAALRGIASGALVRVCNELGEVALKAEVTDDVIEGTVLAPGVWWAKHSPDGRNINQVTAQDEADMGAGALFYDVLVTVTRG
jgi:anaerobic selenocysteine-containing dehydrogenase